jgi:hypothetical protein
MSRWKVRNSSLVAELTGRGAQIIYGPLFQQACRMLEFAVRDSDGHVLGRGRSVESAELPAEALIRRVSQG